MSEASLTIISSSYGSWSPRGRPPCGSAGLGVEVVGGEPGRSELRSVCGPISHRARGEAARVDELDAEF
jgi:hypothetical protein